jgi:hypothetical protein
MKRIAATSKSRLEVTQSGTYSMTRSKFWRGGAVVTMDGRVHNVGKWDMLIAHPPCTYLSNVATRFFSLKCTEPEKVVERWRERAYGAVFFMHFALAHIDKICIENPVGFMSGAYRKADQIIDPYMFAERRRY